MKKSSRVRRRHAPPGPCGVLWEMSRSKSKLREEEEESTHKGQDTPGASALFPEDGGGSDAMDANLGGAIGKTKRDDEQYDASAPAAWTAMQRSLGIVTPYLPIRSRGDVQRRYELLRPHLPQNFILLPEILSGRHDLKISDPDLYLCVWVVSIEERKSHHGIWTVELKDETGATIRAWMEPNFVKEELEKAQQAEESSSNKGVVRVGVVWMLANFSMIAIDTNNNSNSNNGILFGNNSKIQNGGLVERMLVVSRKRIIRVWTPELERAQIQPNEEEDSPGAQRKFLEWMEKRNALTDTANLSETEDGDGPPEEEEMEEEKESDEYPGSAFDRHRSRQRIVGGKEQQERMTEMSALTMTADDETDIVTSQRNTTVDGGGDYRFPATNVLNKWRRQPTSPLAHRNLNIKESSRISINSSSGRNNDDPNSTNEEQDENHRESPVQLQTQESSQVEGKIDTKSDEKNLSSSHRSKEQTSSTGQRRNYLHHDSSQHGEQLLTQPHLAQRISASNKQSSLADRDLISSPGCSPLEDSGHSSLGRTQKRKKQKNTNGHANSLNPSQNRLRNSCSPKRRRGDRIFTCSSPIRMSQSVWNTPDPSILEMLDKGSDDDVEEEEVKTVIYSESSPSFGATQSPGQKNVVPEQSCPGNTEADTFGKPKGYQSNCKQEITKVRSKQFDDESNGSESLLLTGRALLGEGLFEPSNWAGVDMSAFSESDSE